jgi:hypothetical protein
MFGRSFFRFITIAIIFLLLLTVDAVLNVHIFSLGFLLSLVFFIPAYQVLITFLLFGFFVDVRFQLPLGTVFLLLVPYLFMSRFFIQFFRSRMLVLYGYLVIVGGIVSLIRYKSLLEPGQIIATLVFGFVWIVLVYLYAIRRYQDFSFNTKKKTLQF